MQDPLVRIKGKSNDKYHQRAKEENHHDDEIGKPQYDVDDNDADSSEKFWTHNQVLIHHDSRRHYFFQPPSNHLKGKSYHRLLVPFHFFNELSASLALDGIGARFADWLSGRNVITDLFFSQRSEGHRGDLQMPA